MKNYFHTSIAFLLFLFWALLPNVEGADKVFIFLFFIASIPFWREIKNDSLRHWALLLALPFLLTLTQKLFIFPEMSGKFLHTPLRVLLAGSCIFMFYQIAPQKLMRTLLGIFLGAIGLGLWAYFSTHHKALFLFDGSRAWNGFNSPNHFALLSVIFAVMALSLPPALFPKIPPKLFWALKIAAFAFGLYAVFASFSRVALFVLPFLVLILIVQNFKKSKKMAASLAVFISLLTLGIATTENPYKERFAQGFEEITHFKKNPNTSMGLRLLGWQNAWDIIQKNPAFGLGKSTFENEFTTRQKTNGKNFKLMHPHNDYLNFGVEFGIIGVFVALLFYFVPLFFFLKRLKAPDLIVQTAATCGAIIVSAFALGGLVDCYFWISNQIIFYAFSLALFVGIITQIEKN